MKFCAIKPSDVLQREEIAATLDNLTRASVAVLGDFCLDVYWTIDEALSEVSLETDLRTQPIREQRYAPGGAGNVVMNLLALGVHQIYPVGVLGDDPFGRELRRQLENTHIDSRGLLTQSENWATHTYIKPYTEEVEGRRLDLGNTNQLAPAVCEDLFVQLEEILQRVSVVLINHQVIGSLHDSEELRTRLAAMMEAHPDVCFLVDSRGYHEAYAGAVHKLNDREVLRACGVALTPDEEPTLGEVVRHTEELFRRWGAPLVVTRGERGCLVHTPEVVEQIFGVQLSDPTDPVGAGDTFVSALAAIVSTGTNTVAAAFVANLAAAVTAQKLLQTGTASPGEILGLGATAEYACHPELAESPHLARFFENSEIEVIAEPPPKLQIRHAVFDHDGTISTLREGWEGIMEPMMRKAILGGDRADVEEALYRRVTARVRQFIEHTTGIQTITQMHGLVDLVREFQQVSSDEILSPADYKQIYNEELKALVNARLAKLERGELEIDDFTLKGAVPFLRRLHAAGVRLYLASGTDEEDVKEEATRLGYADLFAGGIHGSHGDVAKDAKKIVLDRILGEIDGAKGQLATFGDGPVEMRETVACGAFAVGLASDERRRFGRDLSKRNRLIRAGAHCLIPDFSQGEGLWKFLRLPEA